MRASQVPALSLRCRSCAASSISSAGRRAGTSERSGRSSEERGAARTTSSVRSASSRKSSTTPAAWRLTASRTSTATSRTTPRRPASSVHRLTGIPYSFTAHGSDLHVDRHMLCEKVGDAAFVVAVSEYNRGLILEECGGAGARTRRTSSTAASTPSSSAHATSTAPERPFSILCVGTLHEVKGQGYLVEACRLLAEAGVDVTCTLVGDGPDRAALVRQIADCRARGPRGTRRPPHAGGGRRSSSAGAHVLVSPSVPTAEGEAGRNPCRAHGGDGERRPCRRQRHLRDSRARGRRGDGTARAASRPVGPRKRAAPPARRPGPPRAARRAPGARPSSASSTCGGTQASSFAASACSAGVPA